MTSVTFNSDLFAAPHQLIADSLHSNDPKTRAILENAIKMVSANHGQRIHGKGKEALNQIEPFWRLTVSLTNDDPGLSVLPRPDGSMADKMLLFRASRPGDMPHTDEKMKALHRSRKLAPPITLTSWRYRDVVSGCFRLRADITHFCA